MKFLNWLFKPFEDETLKRALLEAEGIIKLGHKRGAMFQLHCPKVGKNCIGFDCVNYLDGKAILIENVDGELINIIAPPRCKLWKD